MSVIAGLSVGSQETPVAGSSPPAPAQQCVSAATASYNLETCLTTPASNAVVAGEIVVTATSLLTGATTPARVASVVFCLDDASCSADPQPDTYVLTSWGTQGANGVRTFSFRFDTTLFIDGPHRLFAVPVTNLQAEAPASIDLVLDNGTTQRPALPIGFAPSPGAPPSAGAPLTVAFVGDGAGGMATEQRVTSMIAAWNPNMLLYLGDVYQKGTAAEFENHYHDGGYGQFKAITNPVIGNHEYSADDAADGYFRYWRSPPEHYAVDVGGWRLIMLNSTGKYNESLPGGQNSASNPDPNSQYHWLERELNDHPGACTIVSYHHPVFNTGHQPKVGFDPTPGASNYMEDIWRLMADHSVSLVLNGHDHNYQRFVPIGRDGLSSPTGITEIISGGGGHAISPPAQFNMATDGPLLASSGSFYGAARLALYGDRADLLVQDADTGTVFEKSSVPCRGLGPDTVAPQPVTNPSVSLSTGADGRAYADVTWSTDAVPDDRGVATFRIRRLPSDDVVAEVGTEARSWTDHGVPLGTTIAYRITALDAWGNESTSVTTNLVMATAAETINAPLADTYVTSASPTSTYGTATTLRASAGTTTIRTFLQFDLSNEYERIVSAQLRLMSTNTSSTAVVRAYRVNSNSWSEARTGPDALTWNTQPALGVAGASVTGVATDTWRSIDVSSLISTHGVVSLALVEELDGKTVSFKSRQAGADVSPVLVVRSAPPLDTTPPETPTAVTAAAALDDERPVNVSWAEAVDDSGVIDHYEVIRDGLQVGTSLSTSYVDDNVDAGTTYRYAVVAVDRSGNSSPASAITAASTATTLDLTPPEAPESGSAFAMSATTVQLRWAAGEDNSAVGGYQVVRRDVADGPWTTIAETGAAVTAWLDTGLETDRQYDYAVRTIDASGNGSDLFMLGTVTMPANANGDTTPPSAPSGLQATVTLGGVDLAWTAADPNDGVASYSIWRGGQLLDAALAAAATAYRDTATLAAGPVEYVLYAVDAAGNVSAPAQLTATIPDTTAPASPSGVVASATGPRQLVVSWQPASDDVGVQSYAVSVDGVRRTMTSDISAQLTATPSTEYRVSVSAFDAAGNESLPSADVVVSTPAVIPVVTEASLVDDTYVKNGTFATSNYGRATVMRVQGGTTVQNSLVKFSVPPEAFSSGGPVAVTLGLYAQDAQPELTVWRVDDNNWSSRTVTYATAPAMTVQLGTIPATASAGWVGLDVSSWVTQPGEYSLAITTSSSVVAKLSTSEWSAANPSLAPQTPRLRVVSS